MTIWEIEKLKVKLWLIKIIYYIRILSNIVKNVCAYMHVWTWIYEFKNMNELIKCDY